jgi:hypothetical protein
MEGRVPIQKGWMMGDTPNPTSAGPHNHLGPKPHRAPDPRIDRVFGVEAPIIAGAPIEVGSGANPVEFQLADYLAGIRATDGDDAMRAKYEEVLAAGGFSLTAFNNELALRGLKSPEPLPRAVPEEARTAFEQATPDGRPN